MEASATSARNMRADPSLQWADYQADYQTLLVSVYQCRFLCLFTLCSVVLLPLKALLFPCATIEGPFLYVKPQQMPNGQQMPAAAIQRGHQSGDRPPRLPGSPHFIGGPYQTSVPAL